MSKFVITQDGSPTLYDKDTGEHHHSLIGAYTEAYSKFVLMAKGIIDSKTELSILDLPFGLGYNLIALLKYIKENSLQTQVKCTAIEFDREVINLIREYPRDHELKNYFELIEGLDRDLSITGENFDLELFCDDLLKVLPELDEQYDLVFYDPFSPRTAPELWSKSNVLQYLVKNLSNDGLFITYTASNKVRKALIELGLYVGPSAAVGRKMPGTIASKSKELITSEFTQETLEKINKAKPYD